MPTYPSNVLPTPTVIMPLAAVTKYVTKAFEKRNGLFCLACSISVHRGKEGMQTPQYLEACVCVCGGGCFFILMDQEQRGGQPLKA